MREFCDKQPRTAWADPLPDVIRPAQPIPQGERSDESQFEKALNNVAQKAMDYSRNTDFGGEDDDRLRALDAAKNHVIRLHADALAWAQRSKP